MAAVPKNALGYIPKGTIPYYGQMKRAMAAVPQPKPTKKKKPTMLTEYSQNSQKAVLRNGVTVNAAAKKLHDYESTGLQPYEVAVLIEREKNLTARLKKMEGWE